MLQSVPIIFSNGTAHPGQGIPEKESRHDYRKKYIGARVLGSDKITGFSFNLPGLIPSPRLFLRVTIKAKAFYSRPGFI
jgi:hypothetical protein